MLNRTTRRTVPVVVVLVMAVAACVPGGTPTQPGPGPGAPDPTLGGCPMMPADSYWHADVRSLSVDPSSAAWVGNIGASSHVHADFGSGLWDGGPIGIPYTTVGAGQPTVPMTFGYAGDSDPGPYPFPWNAPIEGGAASSGDRHVLVVDNSTCRLYETWDSHPGSSPTAAWYAGSGAVFDLRSNALRQAGLTSADAAGLPILPGLVRYDEVAAGNIDHAIRITVPRTRNTFVWPARHQASSSSDASRPPMGAWLRLKPSVNTAGMSHDARVIAEAMKTHGVIVADNGSSWYISGAPDERWNNDVLHELDRIIGSDFEAVDAAPLKVSADSGQIH